MDNILEQIVAYAPNKINTEKKIQALAIGPRAMVGEITDEQTKFGRPIYKTPEGERVSEKSRTLFLDGNYINVPSIHGGKSFNEDELRLMIKQGNLQPTSVHKSRADAEAAAKARSASMAQGGRIKFEDGMRVMEDEIIKNYKEEVLKELEAGKKPTQIKSFKEYLKTQTKVDTNPGKKKLKKAIEDAKKLRKKGVTLGANRIPKKLLRKIIGDMAMSLGSPTALLGLNAYLGVDPKESLDRAILGGEVALAPSGIKALTSRLDAIKNPTVRKGIETVAGLRLPGVFTPANVMRAARFVQPLGIATLAGEGIYQLGKLGYKEQQRINAMSPEEKAKYLAEQQELANVSA